MGKDHSESYLGSANLEYSFAGSTFVFENVQNKYITSGFLKFIQKEGSRTEGRRSKETDNTCRECIIRDAFPGVFKTRLLRII